ncbi:hypothetical protein O6H91_11G019300 [Diphasiastrum complanatum]|uniref:Uncharacterized protein n=1 Tax=Diphasiastrum complanatum TaxID=34168 RepID=A0ACC2C6S9_DIPCM|nr:hypothetical protein O6H91_11G019300 [Diphasiastrum complanatum]
MPQARVSGTVRSPSVNVFIDMGHPLLNRTVDGFLKLGAVGAAHAASQDVFGILKKESVSKHDLEHMVKNMGKEGLRWGVVCGIYTGMEYGMEQVRGRHDWKNALLGGALTGALLALGDSHYSRDKMVRNAITGGAIATASEFLRYLT